MIEVTAKFIGKNSLGYVHGNTYRLRVWAGRRPGVMSALTYNLMQDYPITIERAIRSEYDGGGMCPYSSIETFLRNWSDVRIDL